MAACDENPPTGPLGTIAPVRGERRARPRSARNARRRDPANHHGGRGKRTHRDRLAPLTSRWLAEAAGCSYPTIASALEKLEKYLTRQTDRRVELKAFPKDEWSRLVANADKVRQTLRFADHSGQPRSIESLVSRLERVRTDDIAIAGVLGARRRYLALDLIGTPRLDLTIHCRTRKLDLSFLRQLDPALKPARSDEPARLVIHTLRYPHIFFEKAPDGSVWADPVECLLDLHEMRLESQAKEFLQYRVMNTL